MIIPIDIADGSPELEELEYVVATINTENAKDAVAAGHPPPTPITVQQYVVPIVLAHFKQRVQNIYLHHAKTKSNTDLAKAFGNLSKVRGQ